MSSDSEPDFVSNVDGPPRPESAAPPALDQALVLVDAVHSGAACPQKALKRLPADLVHAPKSRTAAEHHLLTSRMRTQRLRLSSVAESPCNVKRFLKWSNKIHSLCYYRFSLCHPPGDCSICSTQHVDRSANSLVLVSEI